MQVESEVGKGSTFTVWLPVHPDKRLLRTALVCPLGYPAAMHRAGGHAGARRHMRAPRQPC